MAQIRQVVSETLQATVRRLLPSQQGFTEDLQASNVIQPIIDLTPSAEGSSLPVDLSRALAFGSQTAFSVTNTTTVIVNNTGFYRVMGIANIRNNSTAAQTCSFSMSDGLSNKTLFTYSTMAALNQDSFNCIPFDFIVFLDSGDSLSAVSGAATSLLAGSTRQVADISGNLVNPDGFSAT